MKSNMSIPKAKKRLSYYRYRCAEEGKKGKLHLAHLIAVQLVSWLNPFEYLKRIKVERLYDGYLTDQKVAKDFRKRYLPEQFQDGGGLALDFGCGRGRHCAMLSQCGFKVVGIDPIRYDYWQKIPNAQFLQGSNKELKLFKNESFDLCISFQVLMYIRNDKETVRELARVLRRRGWLVLQLTNQNNLKTTITQRRLINDPRIIRYYTPEEASLMLEKAGFKIERIWTEKFYSPFFTGFFNYLLEIILPHQMLDFVSSRTPPKYRGMINITAQKM